MKDCLKTIETAVKAVLSRMAKHMEKARAQQHHSYLTIRRGMQEKEWERAYVPMVQAYIILL